MEFYFVFSVGTLQHVYGHTNKQVDWLFCLYDSIMRSVIKKLCV